MKKLTEKHAAQLVNAFYSVLDNHSSELQDRSYRVHLARQICLNEFNLVGFTTNNRIAAMFLTRHNIDEALHSMFNIGLDLGHTSLKDSLDLVDAHLRLAIKVILTQSFGFHDLEKEINETLQNVPIDLNFIQQFLLENQKVVYTTFRKKTL
jgi:hypothetical protein